MEQENATPTSFPSENTLSQANQADKFSMNRVYLVVGIIVLLLLATVGVSAYSQFFPRSDTPQTNKTVAPPRDNSELIVGQNIDEDGLAADTKEFQPFINYLANKLSAQGIKKGKFVGTASVGEMADLVRQNRVDIVIDSAFPVYVVNKLAGAQPIADRWKGGVATYHTAFFVKKDSPIKTVNDLKGKMLAFDSNTSTVAYFLPKAQLTKQGFKLVHKDKVTDVVAPDEIGYVFEHDKLYDSVENGTVAAGSESEVEIADHFGDQLANYRIIYRSSDIPRYLVAVRGNLDPKLRGAIENVLFEMDKDSAGQKVLDSFAKTARFTEITNSDSAYGVIKDLSDYVENEIIQQ